MTRTRHIRLLPTLASAALIAAACGASSSVGDEAADTTPASTEAPSEEVLGPEEETSTTTEVVVEAEAEASITELELGGPVDPGRYRTDLLGTEIELDLDSDWIPAVGDPGAFIVEYTDKVTDFSEALIFTRMSSFGSAVDIDDPSPQGAFLAGPPNDFDAWLDASGELIVDSDRALDINGAAAREVQVRVDPAGTVSFPGGCGPGPDDRCFFVGGTQSETLFFYIVRTSEVYRMWLVPQEGFDEPILITAIASVGNETFLDTAGEIVSTITFGEPRPHPVELPDGPLWEAGLASMVPRGLQVVPALGGLQFEMAEERFVFQEQNYLNFLSSVTTDSPVPPGMIVAAVSSAGNGDPINDVTDLLAALEGVGDVTLSGTTYQTLGQSLVGYDFVGDFGDNGPVDMLFSSARPDGSSNLAWTPNDFARLYIGELDDSVLVVGYDGVTEADQRLGQAVFDEVAPTLALIGTTSERRIPSNLR